MVVQVGRRSYFFKGEDDTLGGVPRTPAGRRVAPAGRSSVCFIDPASGSLGIPALVSQLLFSFSLNLASRSYHHALSKQKESDVLDDSRVHGKLLPIDALGMIMIAHGEEFGEDSAFGACLFFKPPLFSLEGICRALDSLVRTTLQARHSSSLVVPIAKLPLYKRPTRSRSKTRTLHPSTNLPPISRNMRR
jgi:hypothetical protein